MQIYLNRHFVVSIRFLLSYAHELMTDVVRVHSLICALWVTQRRSQFCIFILAILKGMRWSNFVNILNQFCQYSRSRNSVHLKSWIRSSTVQFYPPNFSWRFTRRHTDSEQKGVKQQLEPCLPPTRAVWNPPIRGKAASPLPKDRVHPCPNPLPTAMRFTRKNHIKPRLSSDALAPAHPQSEREPLATAPSTIRRLTSKKNRRKSGTADALRSHERKLRIL